MARSDWSAVETDGIDDSARSDDGRCEIERHAAIGRRSACPSVGSPNGKRKLAVFQRYAAQHTVAPEGVAIGAFSVKKGQR